MACAWKKHSLLRLLCIIKNQALFAHFSCEKFARKNFIIESLQVFTTKDSQEKSLICFFALGKSKLQSPLKEVNSLQFLQFIRQLSYYFCTTIFAGCFCVYSDGSSFEYIRESVEKTLLSNLEQDDRLPFQGLPLVIVFASNLAALPEKELLRLKEEGHSLAQSLQCPFVEISKSSNNELLDSQFAPERIEEAVKALIESIRHKSGLLKISKSNAAQGNPNTPGSGAQGEPDIR